jgi:hypothetical protein
MRKMHATLYYNKQTDFITFNLLNIVNIRIKLFTIDTKQIYFLLLNIIMLSSKSVKKSADSVAEVVNMADSTKLSAKPVDKQTTGNSFKNVDDRTNITVGNIIHVTNTTDDSIIVEHNKEELRFTFYNKDKHILGSFSVPQLVKYINSSYTDFMKSIDISVSSEVIKKYVCETYDTVSGVEIRLVSHIDSPFMGNIEMILKMYNDLSRYEIEGLAMLPPKDSKSIQCNVKQLIYLLLNKMLKLGSYISDVIKGDPAKDELKNQLLKYSVGAVYKISNMIRVELDNRSNEYKTLQNDLVRLSKVKLTMYEKMKLLQANIEDQNKQIDSLVSGLTGLAILQGGADTSDISLNSTTSSKNKSSTTSSAESSTMSNGKSSSTTQSTTTQTSIESGSSDTSTIKSVIKTRKLSDTSDDDDQDEFTITDSDKVVKGGDKSDSDTNGYMLTDSDY